MRNDESDGVKIKIVHVVGLLKRSSGDKNRKFKILAPFDRYLYVREHSEAVFKAACPKFDTDSRD